MLYFTVQKIYLNLLQEFRKGIVYIKSKFFFSL